MSITFLWYIWGSLGIIFCTATEPPSDLEGINKIGSRPEQDSLHNMASFQRIELPLNMSPNNSKSLSDEQKSGSIGLPSAFVPSAKAASDSGKWSENHPEKSLFFSGAFLELAMANEQDLAALEEENSRLKNELEEHRKREIELQEKLSKIQNENELLKDSKKKYESLVHKDWQEKTSEWMSRIKTLTEEKLKLQETLKLRETSAKEVLKQKDEIEEWLKRIIKNRGFYDSLFYMQRSQFGDTYSMMEQRQAVKAVEELSKVLSEDKDLQIKSKKQDEQIDQLEKTIMLIELDQSNGSNFQAVDGSKTKDDLIQQLKASLASVVREKKELSSNYEQLTEETVLKIRKDLIEEKDQLASEKMIFDKIVEEMKTESLKDLNLSEQKWETDKERRMAVRESLLKSVNKHLRLHKLYRFHSQSENFFYEFIQEKTGG